MAAQVELENSNISGIGSAADAAARQAAAETEEDWIGAGKVPGVQIWRVENARKADGSPDFGVNPWPKEQTGQFCVGDSYIMLHTFKAKKDSEALSWNAFFWIGSESSQDEYAVAAYKVTELDDLLGGAPVQYREVQGNESAEFLKALGGEITYVTGGVDSGFRTTEPEKYQPRLLQVRKDGKITRAFQMPLARASLNEGDVFILDAGTTVYRWEGKECSPFEKQKAATLAHNIVEGRMGKAKQAEVDGAFWELLGGEGEIQGPVEHAPAEAAEQTAPKCFRITDEDSVVRCSEVKAERASLEEKDAFIVDVGPTIWVWIGKGATKREGQQALASANKLITDLGKPVTTRVVRCKQGQEEATGFWAKTGL